MLWFLTPLNTTFLDDVSPNNVTDFRHLYFLQMTASGLPKVQPLVTSSPRAGRRGPEGTGAEEGAGGKNQATGKIQTSVLCKVSLSAQADCRALKALINMMGQVLKM